MGVGVEKGVNDRETIPLAGTRIRKVLPPLIAL